MVLAARRSYVAAKRATRAARPSRIARARFARRAFGVAFVAGLALLAFIAVVAPSNFGQPGAATARSGWPFFLLLGLIGAVVAYAAFHWKRIAWLGQRLREPLVRPLNELPGFEAAADALASCPSPLRLRWSLNYVWGPLLWALAAGTLAFSSAYFVVDAVLARGRVGWAQPLYAVVFGLLSIAVLAGAAGRLATWRFAMSVHKEVTTGYAG
jgi:uncharacterized membrane protein YdcZ (DUF606 family)